MKGHNNLVADALSCLSRISNTPLPETSYTINVLAKSFGTDAQDLPSTAFPLQYYQ